MTTSIEALHQEISALRKDVTFIKQALREDWDLSDDAKAGLKKARETSESEYVDLE